MTYLVTGASGFVGRALCDELAARGLSFRAAVRHPEAGSAAFACGELDAATPWAPALAGVDVVIHLAARVHVMAERDADAAAAFQRSNVEATLNLARQAVAAGVRRFVYVSSVKVNGECSAPGKAFSAEDAPAPADAYGRSKWQAEQALWQLAGETGLEVVVVRPPLVYGPGVRANFLQLLKLVASGWPLPLGAVGNRRSLLFVGNLVDGLIRCATHDQAAGRTWLLDDGSALSSRELIVGLARAMGVPCRNLAVPVWLLRAVAGVLGRRAAVERLTQSLEVDSSPAREQLGWVPPFSQAEGLRLTAEWFIASRRAGNEGRTAGVLE